MFYSLGERVEILLIYSTKNQYARKIAAWFNSRPLDKMRSLRHGLKLIANFTQTGMLQM